MKLWLNVIILLAAAICFAAPLKAQIYDQDGVVIDILQPQDVEGYVAVTSNPQALETANAAITEAAARRSFAGIMQDHKYLGDERTRKRVGLKIVDKASGQIIGAIVCWQLMPRAFWETSTMILPAFQQKGIGTVARTAATAYLFNQLQVPGLVSVVSASNQGSRKLTEKLGFKLVRYTERDSAVREDEQWLEYRLSQKTFVNEGLPPGEDAIGQTTLESLQRTATSDVPEVSKVSSYYRSLVTDHYVRSQMSPEEISALAEDMAFRAYDAPVDEALVRLTLTKLQRALGGKLGELVGKPMLRLSLRNSDIVSFVNVDGSSDVIFELNADCADGTTKLLKVMALKVGGSHTSVFDQLYQGLPALSTALAAASEATIADEQTRLEMTRQNAQRTAELATMVGSRSRQASDARAAADVAIRYLNNHGLPVADIGFEENLDGPIAFSIMGDPEPEVLADYNVNHTVSQTLKIKLKGSDIWMPTGDIMPRGIGAWGEGDAAVHGLSLEMVNHIIKFGVSDPDGRDLFKGLKPTIFEFSSACFHLGSPGPRGANPSFVAGLGS